MEQSNCWIKKNYFMVLNMGSICNHHVSVQSNRILFNREYEQDFNERDTDFVFSWTDYFKTGNILLVDGDGEWVGQEDEDGDDQWDDDDKMEDDEW